MVEASPDAFPAPLSGDRGHGRFLSQVMHTSSFPLVCKTRLMRGMIELDQTRHDMTSDTTERDGSSDAVRQAELDVLLQVEAADIVGVSVRTIQRAIDRGTLAAQRIEGKCWIHRDALLVRKIGSLL